MADFNFNLKPLNIEVSSCILKGQMYSLLTYEEYSKISDYTASFSDAVLQKYHDKDIVLPVKGKVKVNRSVPGIYNAGIIDFIVYPNNENIDEFVPEQIISMSNKTPMKEMLERKDIMARLDEPWITSPDNITSFQIMEDDKPEMICLKTALNKKNIDIDKYGARFGPNFPNDKRQLKNNSATLNIIKRFCQYMDMEALLTLRDKNPNVPNPIGDTITVSLSDLSDEDEEG